MIRTWLVVSKSSLICSLATLSLILWRRAENDWWEPSGRGEDWGELDESCHALSKLWMFRPTTRATFSAIWLPRPTQQPSPTQHTVLFRAGHTLDGEKSTSIHDSQYFGETRSAPTRYSIGSHKTRTYPAHHTGCEPNVEYAFDGRGKEITSYVVIQTAGHWLAHGRDGENAATVVQVRGRKMYDARVKDRKMRSVWDHTP